ncbi:MAG: tetratricopeptide repeat protein [Bdellovibrionales bacterium]|nr:tetratricopeptide repeat protein [Bdellovibrionales bacterium]
MSENPVDAKQVEKYQVMLEKDPESLVFAPLVDAYRKMGMLELAVQEGLKGARKHPKFAGGRIALAQALMAREQLESAAKELKAAIELSSENIKAFSLLADCLVKLKYPKEALKAYKMVLFLNPNDEKALSAVKKLESITADEFDDDLFEMLPLNTLEEKIPELSPLEDEIPKELPQSFRQIDRVISLVDAFIVRNEFEKARHLLNENSGLSKEEPEVIKRLKLLNQFIEEPRENTPQTHSAMSSLKQLEKEEKIKKLKLLLTRISDKKEQMGPLL